MKIKNKHDIVLVIGLVLIVIKNIFRFSGEGIIWQGVCLSSILGVIYFFEEEKENAKIMDWFRVALYFFNAVICLIIVIRQF